MSEQVVTISAKRYAELIADEEFLNCLRAAGVDNWTGYDYALDAYIEQSQVDDTDE